LNGLSSFNHILTPGGESAPGIFGPPMLFGMPQEVQTPLRCPFPSRLGTPGRLVQHIVTNEMLIGELIRLDGAIRLAPK
jgi:hypothetical protein